MEAARAYFSRKSCKLLKNAPFQLLYFDQNTLYINSSHETTGEYLFLKIHKKVLRGNTVLDPISHIPQMCLNLSAPGGAKGPRHPVHRTF